MKPCPVTGKPCNKSKPFHITDIKNGKAIAASDACPDCIGAYSLPQEKTISPTPQELMQDLSNFFGNFLGKQVAFKQISQQQLQAENLPLKEIGCPNCGISLKTIMKEGKLGCPMCYGNFDMQSVLSQIHGSVKHAGKIPKKWKKQQEQKKKEDLKQLNIDTHIKQMENQMDLFAETENYGSAARLRDAIQRIKNLQVDNHKLQIKMGKLIADDKFEEVQKIKELMEKNKIACLKLREQTMPSD